MRCFLCLRLCALVCPSELLNSPGRIWGSSRAALTHASSRPPFSPTPHVPIRPAMRRHPDVAATPWTRAITPPSA
jgi:hypothetical protein